MNSTFAVVENMSPIRRKHWVSVPFPTTAVQELPDECEARVGNQAWRAVKGPVRGRATVFHILAEFDGHEIARLELLPRITPPNLPFQLHPWVSDSFEKLVPQVGVRVDGYDYWSNLVQVELLEHNNARQRWWCKSIIPQHGVVLEWWADIYSRDQVVDVWGKLSWSDRRDQNWNRTFDAVWLRSGEFVKFDFETMHGIVNNASKDRDGKFVVLLGQHLGFNDGAALPLSGTMLCFKDGALNPDNLDEAVRNMQAATQGPILGCSEAWDGQFLACRNLPRITVQTQHEIEIEWLQFEEALVSYFGWHNARPIGASRTPGQTGNQEDFGATKGTAVTVLLQPRHIYRMRHGTHGDYFRGLNLYELDFKPLTKDNHPNWVTWSGTTHYHTGVSQDRLGKETPKPPATEWYGYDNQHRSQNNLAAYLQLCDDPAAEALVRHHVELDLADYRRRYPQNGNGAPRAQGRTVGTWANLRAATGIDEFVDLIDASVASSRNQMNALGNGPMRVLGTIGPDLRYPVYVNGELQPAVSVWEHGLAIVGLYLAKKERGSSPWLDEVLEGVADFLARYALIEDSEGFLLINGLAWNNGEEPHGGMVRSNPALMPGTGGVAGWTTAGLLVAREVLPQSHPRWDLIDRYCRNAVGPATDSLYWAEWYAVVDDHHS